MIRPLLVALAGIALAAPAAAGQSDRARQALDKALSGRSAGAPVDCISADHADDVQIVDDRTILYRPVGKVVWRNDLPHACPSLGPHETLAVELWGSRLCRNDRIRVVHPGMGLPGPSCALGRFTPYRKN